MSLFIQKILTLFGERLALVTLLLLVGVFFFAKFPGTAYSRQEKSYFIPQESENYQGFSVNPNIPGAPDTESHLVAVLTTTPSPTPTPTPKIDAGSDEIWLKIADCESHQNWTSDTGNGYYGGLQFSQGAWNSVGGSGKPSEASREEQITRGKLLQAKRGWGAWGACSKKLGL